LVAPRAPPDRVTPRGSAEDRARAPRREHAEDLVTRPILITLRQYEGAEAPDPFKTIRLLLELDVDGNPRIRPEGAPMLDRDSSIDLMLGRKPTWFPTLLEVELAPGPESELARVRADLVAAQSRLAELEREGLERFHEINDLRARLADLEAAKQCAPCALAEVDGGEVQG